MTLFHFLNSYDLIYTRYIPTEYALLSLPALVKRRVFLCLHFS